MSIQISTARVTQDQTEHNFGEVYSDERTARKFVYAKAGELLVAGNLCQAPALVTNHTNQSVAAAAAVGDKKVTVTLGATAATANQYAAGYLVINDADGEAYSYAIDSHPAADASASLVVTLSEEIEVALTTDSEYTLVANPYNGVIKTPTTETGPAVGVAIEPIASGKYGWLQVGGVASVLIQGTPGPGISVARSDTTAGAVEIGDGILQPVGAMMATGVTGEHNPVYLNIPTI